MVMESMAIPLTLEMAAITPNAEIQVNRVALFMEPTLRELLAPPPIIVWELLV